MDFGYGWLLNFGHLLLALPAGLAGALLARRRRSRWTAWLLALVAAWAVAAFIVVRLGFRLDAPVEIPTPRFVASGSGRILDMGCGSGRASIGVLLARPRTTVVGLDDWSAGYIERNGPERLLANGRAAGVGHRLVAQSADMRAMPFPDSSFDAVISTYAIDHLDTAGIDRALAEAARVLRPGGEFLLMIIHRDAWLMFAYTPLIGLHALRGPEAAWRARLERAGLEVLEVGRRPGTLFYLARRPGSAARTPS